MNKIREEILESLQMAEHGIVMKRVDDLISIIEQARKVLEWYSDDTTYENYGEGIEIWEDKGKLAKQVLKSIQGDE